MVLDPSDNFAVHRLLATGGMGEVWLGEHVAQRLPVAIKVLTASASSSEEERAALLEEARIIAGLDHPRIVRVLDCGVISHKWASGWPSPPQVGTPYLILEFASGGSLWGCAGQLPWPQIAHALAAVLHALAHAHARGILHLDVKPGNVLLPGPSDVRKTLRLTDFGIARVREPDSFDDEEQAAGTLAYMAPEQLAAAWRDVGPWSDLYAVGGLGWWLATGEPPFHGSPLELLRGHLHGSLPEFVPQVEVPEGLEGWLRRLLAKTPTDRFASAAAAATALLAVDGYDAGDGGPWVVETYLASRPQWLVEKVVTGSGISSSEYFGGSAVPTGSGLPPGPAVPVAPRPRSAQAASTLPRDWRRPVSTASMQLVGAGLGTYSAREVPLVGREEERDLLWSRLLECARTGAPRAVVLSGVPGVGKSRLARWLTRRAQEVGVAHGLRASHSPTPGATDGIAAMVARHFKASGLDEAQVQTRLQSAASPHDLGLLTWLVTGAISSRSRLPTIRGITVAVGRLLEQLAADGPVIVWLDDVQWSEAAQELVLRMLSSCHAPVFVVATARLGYGVEDALAGAEFVSIPRLGSLAHRALVADLLHLAPELAQRVVERTQGNPMFAVQLVGNWVSEGALEPTERGFVLRRGTSELPANVRQVWTAHLERLTGGRTEVLHAFEVAAVLGDLVTDGEWLAVVGEETCSQARAALLHGQLVDRDGDAVRFAHGLLRDSLLDAAAAAGRLQDHHRRCAETLELLYGDHRPVAGRAARHWLAAGAPEPAIDRLPTAFDHAYDAGSYAECEALLDLWDQALTAQGVGDEAPPRAAVWNRRINVCRARFRLGDVEPWAQRLERVATETGDADVAIDAAIARARMLAYRRDLEGARERFGAALTSLGDRTDRRAAVAQFGLGRVAQLRKLPEEAERHYRAALTVYKAIGDAKQINGALQYVGRTYADRREWADAARLFERAMKGAVRAGYAHQAAMAGSDLGNALQALGEVERAREVYVQSAADLEVIGSGHAVTSHLHVVEIDLEGGDLDEAQARLDANRRFLPGRNQTTFALFYGLEAWAAAGRGKEPAWRDALRRGAECDIKPSDLVEALTRPWARALELGAGQGWAAEPVSWWGAGDD